MNEHDSLYSNERTEEGQQAIRFFENAQRSPTINRCVQYSALGNPSIPWSQLSVQAAEDITRLLIPINKSTRGLHAHIELSARLGYLLTQKLTCQGFHTTVSPYAIQSLLLLDDLGRGITHAWGRNDAVKRALLLRLGMRRDLVSFFPNVLGYREKFWAQGITPRQWIESQPIETMLIECSDVFGKRDPKDGHILTTQECLAHHWNSRKNYDAYSKLNRIWPTQHQLTLELINRSGAVYEEFLEYFKDFGISIDEILGSLRQSGNRS